MVRIRVMSPQDLDAVMRLASAVPESPHWARPVYEGFLADQQYEKRIFLAEEDGRLLGFVAAQLVLEVCELASIVVQVTARRRGVASALLAGLAEWAIAEGATRIQLEVRSGNHRAVAFYLHSGFLQDGLRRDYYRDPSEDAVLMSRALEPPADH